MLVRAQVIDQFSRILRVPEAAVSDVVLESVKQLDERRELEPALQQILFDPNETPHGPTEIADVITSRVILAGVKVNAAFILKGKSFPKVRSTDIAHQVMKLRQLRDLGLMVLCAVGDIQDDAHRDFVQGALDAGVDYLILDRIDTARLLLAYEKICPEDGGLFRDDGRCDNGHELDAGIRLEIRVREDYKYEVLSLRDVSHGGAKRYSAVVLLDPHYDREVIRAVVTELTEELKAETYYRSEAVGAHWTDSRAHVVWLYLAGAAEDIRHSNWLARTEWVDPTLDEHWRPLPLKGDEETAGIAIRWNSMYEAMKEFQASHTASKGDTLAVLEPLVKRAIELGTSAAALFGRLRNGEVSIEAVEEQLKQQAAEAAAVYQNSGELPFPPADLQDYDQVCQSLFADVDNIYLPYTDLGQKTWTTLTQRAQLAKSAIEMFERDYERWRFEREKIH